MYYQCPACEKTWYYPIEECLFCKGEIKLIYPQEFTIQAITQVEVPSREHLKFPYSVLLLKDEHGQTHTRKTFREYKVGDKLESDTPRDQQQAVFASKIRYSLFESWQAVWGQLVAGLDNKLKNVVIKINLKKPQMASKGEVTSPQLVAFLLDWLAAKSVKPDQIKVVDRLPAGSVEDVLLKKSGLGAVLDQYKVEFVNLANQPHETLTLNGTIVDLPELIGNSDFLINTTPFVYDLDKQNALVSKNLAEILPVRSLVQLEKVINHKVLPPVLNLLEATWGVGYKQEKSLGRQPIKMSYASLSSAALDLALCKLYQLDLDSDLSELSYELCGEEFEVIARKLS